MSRRKTEKQREDAGTLRKDRTNPSKPATVEGFPIVPKDLGKFGLEFFNEVCTRANDMRILSEDNKLYIYGGAKSYEYWKKDIDILKTITYLDKGYRQVTADYNNHLKQWQDVLKLFGMNPMDRDKVSTIENKLDSNITDLLDD